VSARMGGISFGGAPYPSGRVVSMRKELRVLENEFYPHRRSSTSAWTGGVCVDGSLHPCRRVVPTLIELCVRADGFCYLQVKLCPCGR
jgi:hypothetical protein